MNNKLIKSISFLLVMVMFINFLIPIRKVNAATDPTLEFLKNWAITYNSDLGTMKDLDFAEELLDDFNNGNYDDVTDKIIAKVNLVNPAAAAELTAKETEMTTLMEDISDDTVDIDEYLADNISDLASSNNALMLFVALSTASNDVMDADLTAIKDKVQELKPRASSAGRFLKTWTSTYKGNFDVFASKAFAQDLLPELDDKDYDSAITKIANKIGEVNPSAKTDLLGQKTNIVDAINRTLELEGLLYEYIDDHKTEISNGDLYLFYVLGEELDDSYNDLADNVESIALNIRDSYATRITNKLNSYRDTDINGVFELTDEVIANLETYNAYITRLQAKFNNWDTLITASNLYQYLPNNITRNTLVGVYDDIAYRISTEVSDFVEYRSNNIRTDALNIVSDTTKTKRQRNNQLTDIINELIGNRTDFNNKYDIAETYIDIREVQTTASDIQSNVDGDIVTLIDYVRSLLLEDDELILTTNSRTITIDHVNKYIITKNIYTPANFIGYFNVTYGTLRAESSGLGKIGTNSHLLVRDNNYNALDYTVIAKGDVVEYGVSNITDIVEIVNRIFTSNRFTCINLIAGDMNNDNKVDITDAIMIIEKIF